MCKDLFLICEGTRSQVLRMWHQGKVLQADTLGDMFVSKRTVDNYRGKYRRICIVYSTGVLEV